MDHIDEKIIELKNRKHNPKIVKYTINKKEYEFEEKYILDDKVIVLLPKEFEEMPKEIAALKYPFERRPQLIYTNDSASINIVFNYTDTPIDDSQIAEFKNEMIKYVKQAQPAAKWIDEGMKKVNSKNIGYYEFVTPSMNSNMYNFIFFVAVDGKALICGLNCTENEMKDWSPIGKEIMYSLIVCG